MGIDPEEGEGIRETLDDIMEAEKKKNGTKTNSGLSANSLKQLCQICLQKMIFLDRYAPIECLDYPNH